MLGRPGSETKGTKIVLQNRVSGMGLSAAFMRGSMCMCVRGGNGEKEDIETGGKERGSVYMVEGWTWEECCPCSNALWLGPQWPPRAGAQYAMCMDCTACLLSPHPESCCKHCYTQRQRCPQSVVWTNKPYNMSTRKVQNVVETEDQNKRWGEAAQASPSGKPPWVPRHIWAGVKPFYWR